MFKNTIYRKLDSRGRLVIPKHIREVFKLDECQIEIFSENDLICIRKVDFSAPKIPAGKPYGTHVCNRCICSSCTGFGCPWAPHYWRYKAGTFKKRRRVERCNKCLDKGMGMIHDCDFYTSRKRKKFYCFRKLKTPTNHQLVMKEFDELKKLIKITNRKKP